MSFWNLHNPVRLRILCLGTALFAGMTFLCEFLGWQSDTLRHWTMGSWAGIGLSLAAVLWTLIPRPRVAHPAAGRFCHICGADGFKREPCDAGLHS